MDENSRDPKVVTEQQLLAAVAAQKELFEEKLGRAEETLENRIQNLSHTIQWVAIMALALSVVVAVGGAFLIAAGCGAPAGPQVIIEQPLPNSELGQ